MSIRLKSQDGHHVRKLVSPHDDNSKTLKQQLALDVKRFARKAVRIALKNALWALPTLLVAVRHYVDAHWLT